MTLNSQFKNLAIIPARANSKGLPGKNTKLLKEKPMLAYSIGAAVQSECFDKIIVSTDDQEIAAIAKRFHAEVPFIRPEELAVDTAKIIDVVLHAVEFFESRNINFDAVTLLQPTSPLRTAQDISNAMKMFIEKNANSVVSVCEADHPPLWMNVLPEDNNLIHFLNKDIVNKRRQDLPIYYRLNGAIYIASTHFLKRHQSFYSEKSFAYIMPRLRSVDVDEIMDFHFCETLLNNNEI